MDTIDPAPEAPPPAAPTATPATVSIASKPLAAYICLLLGTFISIVLPIIGWAAGFALAIVGVVLAHLASGDAEAGTASHGKFIVRTFWPGFLISLICIPLSFIGIGFLILIPVGLWVLVRYIVGLIKLATGNPIANPSSLLIG